MKLEYYLILALCFLARWNEIGAIGAMGPLRKIILHSIYDCTGDDKPKGDDMILKANLININDKGEKALDAIFVNKIPLDDNLNYILEYKIFENGNWKKFYNVKGKPCRDFDRYIKSLWKKVTDAGEPKLDKPCPIPPGSYKLNKFQMDTRDLGIKTFFYGNMMLKLSFTDKKEKVLMCVIVVGDSQGLL